MKMTGAELIIRLLERQGITRVAGIPGSANLPIYTALTDSHIEYVLARHEQGAGFISQGMARSSGKPAVCFATSGPGAANAITAIADAKLDSVPMIVITGQVATGMMGTDAFQEVDTYGLTIPITKHNFLVRRPEELLDVIPEAFTIAQSGRPGPVVIDIPRDVQAAAIEFDKFPDPGKRNDIVYMDMEDIQKIAQKINSSKKPLIYVGGGIAGSDTHGELFSIAKKNNIPVTTSLMGLGAFPSYDPLFVGMLGMHGARYTNYIMDEIDLLIALGVRFDDRATGKILEFAPEASIIHIDIDQAEIDKIRETDLNLVGDLRHSMKKLVPIIENNTRDEWVKYVTDMKAKYPYPVPDNDSVFHPVNLLKTISSLADYQSIITTDVGQHQMWTAQYYPFNFPRTMLTSGGFGTMGFGLPAAIGAAIENPEKRVICISGDGSFLMNIQELATLKDLELNVTVFIMNNQALGLVRQQQELFFDKKYVSSLFESNPDFAGIADKFGIHGINLELEDNPMYAIARSLSEPGPFIVNVPISVNENVYPIVPPGAANREMVG
ncbi:MAG: biosynthetic-type acetolactate synthase large subunit [Spirochaetota bacterium]